MCLLKMKQVNILKTQDSGYKTLSWNSMSLCDIANERKIVMEYIKQNFQKKNKMQWNI